MTQSHSRTYFPVRDEDSAGAVLQVLPLEESPAYNWELEDGGIFSSSHDQLDGWSPRREWPDRPLPGAPANTTELTSALIDKIEQDIQHLLTNLKEIGFDISLKDSSKEPVTVPIPLDSPICPICDRKFYNHYIATLHYKGKHLHQTKQKCHICSKYLTSQANLDLHVRTIHVTKNYKCRFCPAKFFKTSQECLEHMDTHGKFQKADRSSICTYCHQPKGDIKGHLAICKHNLKNKEKKGLVCPL